jgi:hypothetical protein
MYDVHVNAPRRQKCRSTLDISAQISEDAAMVSLISVDRIRQLGIGYCLCRTPDILGCIHQLLYFQWRPNNARSIGVQLGGCWGLTYSLISEARIPLVPAFGRPLIIATSLNIVLTV